MEINVSVNLNLDWIDPDEGIDNEVKAAIVLDVKRQVMETFKKNIDEVIQTVVESSDSLVKEKVSSFLDNWLTEEVTLTDRYGSDTFTGTIEQIIKRNFAEATQLKVNSEGRFTNTLTNRTCESGTPLLELLATKRIRELLDKEFTYLDSKIKDAVKLEAAKQSKEKLSLAVERLVEGK